MIGREIERECPVVNGFPWFEAPARALASAVAENRLPHALLIVIPPGWGREAFVRELARVVMALPSVPADLRSWAHADFLWVQSVDREGEPGKVIQIDAVRELGGFAAQRAAVARCKLAILPQAHNMNTNAANALLKTLEEPASDCCIVLETHRPAQLLPTVVSRCQKLPFRFPRLMAETFLRREGQTSAVDRLDPAGGGPLDALALYQNPDLSMESALGRLASASERNAELDRLARMEQLVPMLDQWYRLVIRALARAPAAEARARLLDFADELLQCRWQIESVKGANTRLLLDRLAFLWAGCLAP
jgi:DNA polymerase-3 subunit delta'